MATHSNGEHPQGDHGGEVEGGDAGTDADGQRVRIGVHVLGNVVHRLAHLQRGDTAAVLDNLCGRRVKIRRSIILIPISLLGCPVSIPTTPPGELWGDKGDLVL